MHHKQIELLKLLLDATLSGSAVWRCEEKNSHFTELAGLQCSLRFKHPLLADNNGSDADAVEVVAGPTSWTFYSGSEGFNLVSDILAAAYPEYLEHSQRISAKLDEAIERIKKQRASVLPFSS